MVMDHVKERKESERCYDTDDESDFSMMKRIKMEPDGILSQDDDIMAQLQQESSDLEVEPSFAMDTMMNGDNCCEGIFKQHMDIREPLSKLRNLLEEKLGIELSDYTFWLQDSQMFESHKNLVDQCVQGEGLVQVNVQIKQSQKRINIVDVLKPTEDYIDSAENDFPESSTEENKNVIRWIVDAQYKKEQERLKIPKDLRDWTQPHVKHWLLWAVRQFNLVSLKLADWNITGTDLYNLTLEEFQTKVPHDPGDVFWTHLELLRKCNMVAVVQKDLPMEPIIDDKELEKNIKLKNPKVNRSRPAINQPHLVSTPAANLESSSFTLATANRSINSGQIQLWQFLLELLTDREHKSAIQWIGSEGEFKLNQPETVAQLWGARKNKPSMNYEKLSRALRYYYDGDMISKVQGKRFVYKFVCDLKQLLGYSAAELSKLVDERRDCF